MDHYTYSLVEALIHFDIIKQHHDKEKHGKVILDREDIDELTLTVDKGLNHKQLIELVEATLQERAEGRTVGNYRILDSNFNYFNLTSDKLQITVKAFFHSYTAQFDPECLYCTIKEDYNAHSQSDNRRDKPSEHNQHNQRE